MRLSDMMNENTIHLSDTQKSVLILIHIAETPELAYEAISGEDNLYKSAELLRDIGFIRLFDNTATLTSQGRQSLISYNLISPDDQPTETGQELVSKHLQQNPTGDEEEV